MKLYDKDALNALNDDRWEFNAYHDFKAMVTDEKTAFPCTLGVAGFSANQLRFRFIESGPESGAASFDLAAALQIFEHSQPYPSPGCKTLAQGDPDRARRAFVGLFLRRRAHLCSLQYTITPTQNEGLEEVVANMLPPTGSVEVQYDTPFRIHPEHVHHVDETLHIIQGAITFLYSGHSVECKPGDRLLLPANTPHASKAGKDGCLYVIATRMVAPPAVVPSPSEMAHA